MSGDLNDSPDAGAPLDLGVELSHDLRAPLRVAEGFARILKEDYGPSLDRRANDHLDRILAATQRMHGMIDVLLELTRLGRLPMAREAVDLSQMAERILDELQAGQPGRSVRLDIQPGLVKYGDRAMLRRVMENLLGNAWKYTGQRALAVIEVYGKRLGDGRVACCVRDNGVGFDMRLAPGLFAPFHRLHSASDFPGTGVGLAAVKRLVERHGGEVGAEGQPDHGALFWFTVAERVQPVTAPTSG